MQYVSEIKTKNIQESKENLLKSIKDISAKNRKLYFFRIEHKDTKVYIGENILKDRVEYRLLKYE